VSYDRRTLVVSALALIVVIVGGMAIVAITGDERIQEEPRARVAGEDVKPSSIPRPGEGSAPSAPNEPGGAEQLALFGLVLTAMAGIGVVVFRGGKRARAGRAEWLAAGRTGHDGVLVAHDQLAPDADLTPASATSERGSPSTT
jgi:hypothetical protein